MKQDAITILIEVETVVVACATNITWDYEQATEEPEACKGDVANVWVAPARGAKSISGSLEGIIDYASASGMRELAQFLIADTNITIIIGTGVVTDDRETIEAIITRVGGQAGSSGKGTYSADFIGDGTAPVLDLFI